MPTGLSYRRISTSFKKLFSNNHQRNNSDKPKISYPQYVQSTAPVSPPFYRKKDPHYSKYRPTPAEEYPCSDASFTCAGLHDFRDLEYESDSLPTVHESSVSLRTSYPPSSSMSSEWVPQLGAILRTDELCKACSTQSIREVRGLCKNCKFYHKPFLLFAYHDTNAEKNNKTQVPR